MYRKFVKIKFYSFYLLCGFERKQYIHFSIRNAGTESTNDQKLTVNTFLLNIQVPVTGHQPL